MITRTLNTYGSMPSKDGNNYQTATYNINRSEADEIKLVTVEEVLNFAIQNEKVNTNLISDGYHTFGELYEHRITNFLVLCRVLSESNYPYMRIPKKYKEKGSHDSITTQEKLYDGKKPINPVWRSKKHSDGELAFSGAWFVLGIFKEAGNQITYHLPIEAWDKTEFAETLETAPEWDGHTSSDVLERLANLLIITL